MDEKKIYLVDGHSLLFKAFFGVRGLTNPQGMPVNAIFGFAQTINRIIEEIKPGYLCVCFDLPGKTFRNDIYPDYKAHRPPTPEDLDLQTPHAKRFVVVRGVRTAEKQNYESDDIMVTLARRAAARGFHAYILSTDKDLLQAVGPRVTVVRISKNNFDFIDREKVIAEYGVPPEMMPDFQGLVGDSSDNIPGVPGIGEKTAPKLLEGFKSLEELLAHLDKIPNPKHRDKLRENADKALLSKRLATLRDDVALDFDLEDCIFQDRPSRELYEFYKEMGFARLRDSVGKALGGPGGPGGQAIGRVEAVVREEQRDLLSVGPEQADAPAAPQSAAVAVFASVPAAATQTQIIWARDDLKTLTEHLRRAKRFAFDTETTSSDAMRARLVGLSLSYEADKAVYIPVGHQAQMASHAQLPMAAVRDALQPLFKDKGLEKVAQNAKYDMHVLARHGIEVDSVAFDPMIASYLLDPEAPHGLKMMARQRLGVAMTPIEELIGSGKDQITMDGVSVETAAAYSGADSDLTLRLTGSLAAELRKADLWRMFEEIEMPLCRTLMRMEERGITIDPKHFEKVSREIEVELGDLAAQAYKIVGREFNLDSPKQLSHILFEELKLPAEKRTKSGLSTDVSVLEELSSKHPLPKLMLEYRGRQKIKSTYVDALPRLIHPETGRIHTSFNQTIAATGRLSSSDPNLQNIPARTPLGLKVREGFLPSRRGNVLLAADYSQIELRILAHVTAEPALIEAFRKNQDIHRLTAAKVLGLAAQAVTPEQRAQAKTVNFGVLYGMSAMRLARQLDISLGKAAAFIKEYFAAYPGVKKWMQAVIVEARERGYVTTLLGRRRYLPNLASKSPAIRANAERMAVNTPIQGSAADMIKVAMLRIEERLADGKLDAQMILQVHDELIFDVPESAAKELSALVREEMQQALPLSVPMTVDVKTGKNWAEC